MKSSADPLTPFDPSACATLIEVLRKRAFYQPDKQAYTFLMDGEAEERSLTYAELDRGARAVGARLQAVCPPGGRALLLYPFGVDFIFAFFGCLYAGVVAVPAYPPVQNRSLHRIQAIAADAQAEVALTTNQVVRKMGSQALEIELGALKLIETDGIPAQQEGWQDPQISADMLSFLQYTSGSTGMPRGVMVSHRNLMHNLAMMCERWQHTSASVNVSWLPVFHDMGLIAGILQPLYVGFLGVVMAPTAFLQRPLRWLEAISRYRGTTSWAPNFAYDICSRRVTPEELSSLDLRSWRIAGNGAEPVRAETLKRFAQTFGPSGFCLEAFTPGYGLAEGTLLVSSNLPGVEPTICALDKQQLEHHTAKIVAEQADTACLLVGCGNTSTDQKVIIVRPETRIRCQATTIGEIWIAGPSVASGYWKRTEETREIFQATLADTGEGPYLRTGDLGFIYKGEIFVTGRWKDLMIIRGRNSYPQDIELAAEHSHPSLRPGCGAAFSVEIDNEERLVIVQEVARHYEEKPERIIQAIRQAIAEQYEISAHAIVLVRPGSISKTSSGKIQRRACREAFLKKELAVVATDILEEGVARAQDPIGPERQQVFLRQWGEAIQAQKRTLLQALVIEQVKAVLHVKPEQQITPTHNLLALGLDSLTGTQLVNRLQSFLGRALPNVLTVMMSEPTINKLVDHLALELAAFEIPDFEALQQAPVEVANYLSGNGSGKQKAGIPSRNVEVKERTLEHRVGPDEPASKNMQFSLLYFASDGSALAENKYELLQEGVKFADRHDFTAVWVPERHFHPFGGLYPNPSVLAAALAMVTQKIRLRAGSVVLPMHQPVRVAEEWSVVDNLSGGRVDLAFAIGWNPNDFVLAPANYADRKEIFFSGIETFQKLWRGDPIVLPNGLGKETPTRIYPAPLQPALTPWITCTGSLERFIEAGSIGANILTGLLFQSLEELAEKIQAYRNARARHGYDPMSGHVTLMLHTFVGEDLEEVRQLVRAPFIEYLRSSVDLWRNKLEKLDALSAQEQEEVLSYAFERYFQTHGLFGTPQTCKKMVERLRESGIDEIACLIDFGLDTDTVINGLYVLNALRKQCQKSQANRVPEIAAAPPAGKSHQAEKEPARPASLRPIPRDQDPPLSFAQQRLWFLEQLTSGKALYNEYVVIRLKGQLRIDVLELSFNEIVSRHEILRTTFLSVGDETRQHIAPWRPQKLLLTSLQAWPLEEREARAKHLAEVEIERPFDFIHGPLFKVQLFQLTDEDHLLCVKFHQTVGDGWSMGIFFRELSALYRAYSVGEASPLAALPLQYADYTLWQQQWQQEDSFREDLAYWRHCLKDAPPQLNLPTDRPRPAVQSYAGAQQRLLLPPTLLQQLKTVSERENVTLFVTVLATFFVLLMRYSGQQDILVGSPIANRTRRELEDVIGFFVNTLVLRADLSGNPSFRQLLGRIREMTLQAYAHQDLPFEKLVAQVELERDLSHHPLFQVAFVLQNFPLSNFDLPGVSWSPLELAKTTAKFDLVVTLTPAQEGLFTTIEYRTDLFEAATIERLSRHWQVLLEAVVHDVEERIESLPLLTNAEREQVLDRHEVTPQVQPAASLQQLFEQQVAYTPDSIALVFEQTALTYRELNSRANQVAHYLKNWKVNAGPGAGACVEGVSAQKCGVGPGMLVGLMLERSFAMIIGILGILKAGGAFMPLDPAYPQERLAFMLQDAQISVLLTQQQLLKKLPVDNVAVLCLDTDWGSIAEEHRVNPGSETCSDDPAYVIYTSGSTGRPRGVLVPHGGVCNLARTQIELFEMVPGSRELQFASFSFDAFVSEIFMALFSGAALHLVSQETLLPGPELLQLFERQAITHATLPPSLLAALPADARLTVQTLIVAGEVCPEEVARHWVGQVRFFNAYGPSEATVCATCAQYTSAFQKSTVIGSPIANVEVYLLDAHLQPVPIGVPGEIYIGGSGLAHGYLKRTDLTAERFLPHPFSSQQGERLYRTGDLACYQPDRSIVFLGRIDRQVKVHGFRIEPEEIEAVLNRHPAIQQSAVALQEDVFGEKRLAAFVVPAQKEARLEARRAELWPSVAEYFVYDELLYFAMTHDERRNRSYRAAINQTVKDKVVLDIGTGKDAILARFCIEGGARRVYAIEILEETYEQARACIQSLGLEEKIILIHGDSTCVQLPEKVDVCVSEIVGSIGGSEGAVRLINDARRFLKPEGIMIPARSVTKIAAVALPEILANDPGFTPQTAGYVEKIFAQIGYPFDLRLCVKHLSPDDLVSSTDIFEDLDFTASIEPDYIREIMLTVHKSAKIDGFLVWLNLSTIEGEEIDILREEFCWLPVYLPVFYPGIEVAAGDCIKMSCSGTLADNQLNPDYALTGSISRQNGEELSFTYTSFHHKRIFKENAFYQELFPQGEIKVQRREEPPSVEELRNFLKDRLPSYMLPAALVIVEALPLMPNGKVDLQALSRSVEKSAPASANAMPPRTATEQAIARIWQEVLDLESVEIHDNFFDLGGHSLLLGRIHEGLCSALGKEVSMMDLFTYPTISSLIDYLNQGQEEAETFQQSHDRARARRASVQRPQRTKQKPVGLLEEQQGVQDE